MRVSELSRGERLLISRRRSGYTQAEAAEAHEVSLYQYRQWEKGKGDAPLAKIKGCIKPHEQCMLCRMRAGVTIKQLAADLELCRWWVQQMERGQQPCDRLVQHWGLKD